VLCRLRSKEAYQEFLKTLNLYAQDVITRGELVGMVQDLLSRHNDIAVRVATLSFHM
jgi:paired amphipathic helix protein Sin3a